MITASAGANGTVTPAGVTSTASGTSRTYTITPAANYHIAKVIVDGSSVGQVAGYTFENISASHTIEAVFEIDTFTITASAGVNGTISPASVTSIAYGTSQAYSITPAANYHIADVVVDGNSVGQIAGYSFENISASHAIEAVFEIDSSSTEEPPVTTVEDPGVVDDGNGSTEGGASDPVADGMAPVEDVTPDTGTDGAVDSSNEVPVDSTESDTPVGENHAPNTPVPVSYLMETDTVGPVELDLNEFVDPDAGDYHLKTEWQVFRTEGEVCVLRTVSTSSLTVLSVPAIMLDESTGYYWKARFFDSNSAASEWSETASFTTGLSDTDMDGNGLPDDQEVDLSIDLNRDRIPDAEQEVIKSIMVPGVNLPVGLSMEKAKTVTAILYLEAIDPEDLGLVADSSSFQYGLINFKLAVNQPGDTAVVTVYFMKPIPKDTPWVKYDPIQNVLIDYSDHVEFSRNQKSVTLELVDGGFGDDDGVANGIIVDPSGLKFLHAAVPADDSISDSGETTPSAGSRRSRTTNRRTR